MEESLKKHWDCNSQSYNIFVRKGFSNKKERRSWQALFKETFGEHSIDILDTGCGPGIVSMQLADLGYNMTSIDFSEEMLKAAKQNALDNGLKIRFVWADAEKLPFDDCSFDAVVCDYMLWTVPNPKKVMEEWFRVMKPEATLAYIDGNWWNDEKNTSFRRNIARIAMFLDSPKKFIMNLKPEKNDMKCVEIWSKNASRPDDDIEMLRKIGFKDIKITHNIQNRVLHGIRHMAYGSTEDHFMVIAKKSTEEDFSRSISFETHTIKNFNHRIDEYNDM